MDVLISFKPGLGLFVEKELKQYKPAAAKEGFLIKNADEKQITSLLVNARTYESLRIQNGRLIEKDLSARGYEVRAPPTPSDVVSCMIDWSSWNEKKVLLDPFCENSSTCIEAAMKALGIPTGLTRAREFGKVDYSKVKKKLKILCYSSEMKSIKLMQKQAVLAMVNKSLTYSKQAIKNIDLKLDEKSVDNIITSLPRPEPKIVEELFFQAEHILKKKGQMIIYTSAFEEVKEWARVYDFVIVESINVGEQKLLKIEKKD